MFSSFIDKTYSVAFWTWFSKITLLCSASVSLSNIFTKYEAYKELKMFMTKYQKEKVAKILNKKYKALEVNLEEEGEEE